MCSWLHCQHRWCVWHATSCRTFKLPDVLPEGVGEEQHSTVGTERPIQRSCAFEVLMSRVFRPTMKKCNPLGGPLTSTAVPSFASNLRLRKIRIGPAWWCPVVQARWPNLSNQRKVLMQRGWILGWAENGAALPHWTLISKGPWGLQ